MWTDPRRFRGLVIGLLFFAFVVRLGTQGWDRGVEWSPHPDERRVVMTAAGLEGWFDDPEFFAYGTLHFQAVRALAGPFGGTERWDHLIRAGRALSLAASMISILLGWWLVRRAWGRRTSLLFLALVAVVPLDQQLSHYATVEAHHAAWVMAALAAIFGLGRRGNTIWAVLAGGALGASLAVKISSLALILPVTMILVLGVRRRSVLHRISLAAWLFSAALTVFWLGEPWAFVDARPPLAALAGAGLALVGSILGRRAGPRFFAPSVFASLAALFSAFISVGAGFLGSVSGLVHEGGQWWETTFNPAFLAGVGEQIAMVRGAADLPYVRVYHGTIPVLYSLRELAFWALGPALVLAGLWAGGRGVVVLGRRWRRWSDGRFGNGALLLTILVAWMLPTALRLATLEVKFLRYWAPLVVPIVMLAAWGITRLRGPAGLRLRLGLVVLTAFWGVTYFWAFVDAHPFATATRWLETVIDRGAVVAWEHWDEHLAGIGGDSILLESYNLPDDEAKVGAWCENLARAEWVILTSNRVRRTVLANPERFEQTGRLYRLLLSERAGFEVVATASRGPRLAGLRMPVQRADESFVNYEFPRVVALRRSEDVAAEDLAARIRAPIPELEVLDFAALDELAVNRASTMPVGPTGGRQWADIFLWLGFFLLIGSSSWLLLSPLLRDWPDGGLGLALTSGWIFAAWLLWVGSRLGIVVVSPAVVAVLITFFVVVAVSVWWGKRVEIGSILWGKRRAALRVLLVFALVFGFFLLVRALNPAIYWGEKPMDFTFFNAFVNASSWPSGEPWMAGRPLHYYYFSQVLAALPTIATEVEAEVAYNLMCATIPALAAAALASFGMLAAGRRRGNLFIVVPALVLLTGNLAWPWLVPLARVGRWFDLWWATSRVIPGAAIDEYPLWTAIFADLHAHFVALPLMVAALLWAWVTVVDGSRRWIGAAVACGLATAVLAATNPWDIVVFVVALLLTTLVAAPRPLRSLGRLVVAAAVSVAAAAPFVVELAAWVGGGEGVGGRPLAFLTSGEFVPWWAILRHFGLFIVPLAAAALTRASRPLVPVVVLAAVGAAAGLGMGSTAAALSLALAVLFFAAARGAKRDRWTAGAWTLAGTAMAVVALTERMTFLDRMNTIFKLYNGVWLLLAVALGLILLRGGKRHMIVVAISAPLAFIAALNLPLGVVQAWLQPRIASPRPTLDGMAYLAHAEPGDHFLVTALRGAARSDDVVAEAAGPSYGQYSRIAMNTGLATVVGWEWHLLQRGQSISEYHRRVWDLEMLYRGGDDSERRAVLDRYGVDWVVVGRLERETYGIEAEDPMACIDGIRLWARSGEVLLYRVDRF